MQEAYRFAMSAGSIFPTGFCVASWRQDTLDGYLITLEYFKPHEQLETIFRAPERLAWPFYNKDLKMNISELQVRATRLERELRQVRDLLAQAAHDAGAVTAELVRTQAYACSAALPLEDVVARCVDSLDRYGFCVIDNVIPDSQVDDIRDEVLSARDTVTQKIKGISSLVEREGLSAEELLKNPAAKEMGLRPVRRVGHPPKIANDIVWMPNSNCSTTSSC